MQQQEPPTGQEALPPTAPTQRGPVPAAPVPASATVKKKRRRRLLLAIVGGVMAILCLGGAGVFVALYDNATKIKRSAPDAVVDDFLREYLDNRDDESASLYECKSGGNFSNIASYRADIESREKQYSVGIRVSWTTFTVQTSGNQGTVTTDLVKTAEDQSGRLKNTWQFTVVDQDGWRVCGATETS